MSSQPDPAMTSGLDGLSASDIATAVKSRKLSALGVTDAALARIAKRDPILNSFTDVTTERARAKASAIDAAIAAGKKCRPARRCAIRGQEPVRRTGPVDPRRIENQPRPAAVAARRHADRAPGSGRRGLGGRPQHGRIRYDFTGENIHDGPLAQSA
ncbi:MAG: hypothetical protein WDN50_04745 [Bradyrhizobium sp.]